MKLKHYFLFTCFSLVAVTVCQVTLPRVKFAFEDSFFFESSITNKSIYLKFTAERYFAENSLAISFKPFSNLACPSYTHWFKKDSDYLPCFHFAAVCSKYEHQPAIRADLARDWKRIKDNITDGYWHFEATLEYDEDEQAGLEEFGMLEVNEIRFRSNSTRTESVDFTYYLKGSTIVLN